MLDFLSDLFKFLFYTAAVLFFLLCLPFVVAHVVDHWDDPPYPYTGFTPDCPTWEPPYEPENTLPPTYSLAAGDEF